MRYYRRQTRGMACRARWWCMVGAALVGINVAAVEAKLHLTGSGASFPFPLYTAWFDAISRLRPAVRIDYQSKGSGAGIQDLINRTVDFAATDAPLKPEEIAQVPGGVVALPMTAGELVLAYNVPGIPDHLKLPREVYPAIFSGKIKHWNDRRIALANPGIPLPALPVTVVRRAESSGTTYIFTNHLSAIDPEWRSGLGVGTLVDWPKGDWIVSAAGNAGVTAAIKQHAGAIGYVEYGHARAAKMPMAMLQNRAGAYVQPGRDGGRASLSTLSLEKNLMTWTPDPSGETSYPIASFSWMLCYRDLGNPGKAAVLRDVVEFGLTDGQKIAEAMGYIPLPEDVVQRVRQVLQSIQ